MAARLSLATRTDVAALAEAARSAGRLGVDTEFMSEGRYRALLCLVGVVVREGETGSPGDLPDGSGKSSACAPPINCRWTSFVVCISATSRSIV